MPDLQVTYSNYKNTLQQIAQRIGDIEQEAEEHKYVPPSLPSPSPGLSSTEATTMTSGWPNHGSVMPYPGNLTAFEGFTPLILTFKC